MSKKIRNGNSQNIQVKKQKKIIIFNKFFFVKQGENLEKFKKQPCKAKKPE